MNKIAVISIFIGLIVSVDCYCQDINQLRSQREKSLLDISRTEELLKQTQDNRQNELQNLKLINRKIVVRSKVISGISNEISLLDQQIKNNETAIDTLESEIAMLKRDYGNVIFKTYLNRNAYHRSQYIFAATDFNQAFKRLKYMQQYARFRKGQAEKIEIKTEELRNINIKQEEDKNQRSDLLLTEKREMAKLNNDKKDQEGFVKDLQKKERLVKKDLEAQKTTFRKLEREIAKIIAAATGSELSSTGMRMTPEEKIISNEFSQNMGRLPWPVARGVISLSHGRQNVAGLRNVEIDNPGISIVTEENAIVKAVFAGKVSSIMLLAGGNLCVLIKHGEYFSVYVNIGDLKVEVGDNVKIKQEIGRAIHDGKQGNPEFVFQIWKGRDNLDPEKWLAK
ncbi:MAG: peptidoglycan DD-metalloendopeptidase family protein [Bacteroidia bacterium]|nr:peptidoglycan DD-metalloendopeptidase family protein [Bacteroidia bacterium]